MGASVYYKYAVKIVPCDGEHGWFWYNVHAGVDRGNKALDTGNLMSNIEDAEDAISWVKYWMTRPDQGPRVHLPETAKFEICKIQMTLKVWRDPQ